MYTLRIMSNLLSAIRGPPIRERPEAKTRIHAAGIGPSHRQVGSIP